MRTFIKTDIRVCQGRFRHIGFSRYDRGLNYPIFLTHKRYLAERLAIRAREPVNEFCGDEEYFAIRAVERARLKAHRLLDEIGA